MRRQGWVALIVLAALALPLSASAEIETGRGGSGPVKISVADASIVEGTSPLAPTKMRFVLRLSRAVGREVSVRFETFPIPNSACPCIDYLHASKRVRFAEGKKAKRATVLIAPDSDIEGNELFGVRLSGPQGGRIGDGTAIGTILDDD